MDSSTFLVWDFLKLWRIPSWRTTYVRQPNVAQRKGLAEPPVSLTTTMEDGIYLESVTHPRMNQEWGLSGVLYFGCADSDGRTPLSWAADCGHLNAVEILVAKGAELNSKVCGVVAWTLSTSLCIPNQLRNLVVWFKSATPIPTFLGSVARWTQTKRCRDN